MRVGGLWCVLLVGVVILLGLGGREARAADLNTPPVAGARSEAPAASPVKARAAKAHRHHHRRHRWKVRHHVTATHRLRTRTAAAQAAPAAPAALAAAPCADPGDAMSCRDVQDAQHSLILAEREAMIAGVPAPILRVGLDAWLTERDQAAHRSREAVLHVYDMRVAFVRQTVAARPDWRSFYSPGAAARPLGV